MNCDGYGVKAKAPSPLVRMQKLTARPIPLCRFPPNRLFRNEQERRYFSIFCNQTSSQLTGLFSSDLWKRLVLQVSERTPFIRYAVIALGALDPSSWREPRKSPEEVLRRQFAYHEYSNAISDLRNCISHGALDSRTRLIACLLFFCFEMYHQNRGAATTQIRAMSLLSKEYRAGELGDPTKEPQPKIEEELLDACGELEHQTLVLDTFFQGFDEGFDVPGQKLCFNPGHSIQERIAPVFETFYQARSALHRLSERQLNWGIGCSRYGWPWFLGPKTTGSMDDLPPNEYDSDEEYCAERMRRSMEYTTWSSAFQPLLAKARSSNDPHSLRRATVVRVKYLQLYLRMMAPMLSPKEAYYGQTEKLTELVQLCKELLQDYSSTDGGFCMESHVVMPLGKVAYTFRHRALRKEAIRLLIQHPRKEGLAEGLFIGKASQFLAEVEEKGLRDEEYVPHYLATTLVETDIKRSKRTARLVAYHKNRHAPEKMERKEKVIWW
jgi:hypothetical protein